MVSMINAYFAVFCLILENYSIMARLDLGNSIKAEFRKEEGKTLTGWVIKSLDVSSPAECTLECMSTSGICKSFNYKLTPDSVTNKHVCQLNSKTRIQKASQYVSDAGFVHYYNFYYENIKTCLDILRMGIKKSGKYKFHIGSFFATVYCDLDSERNSAWTLIMSYSFKNRHLEPFQSSMSIDKPYQRYTPKWDKFRMTLADMQEISRLSAYVRMTASFDKYGVDYLDYLRTAISNFNILTFNGAGVCVLVHYINVHGNTGNNIQTSFWQGSHYMFHIDTSFTPGNCQFDGRNGAVYNNDIFGFYGNINTAFRGCENDNSTTNFWFGGYL